MLPVLEDLYTKGDAQAWAVTNKNGDYRYLLGRKWVEEAYPKTLVMVMLNPSKARHDVGDPTITKCMGFGLRNGCGALVVANLFAYSATDPRELLWAARSDQDIIGPGNHDAIHWAIHPATGLARTSETRCVMAWGRLNHTFTDRSEHTRRQIPIWSGGRLYCLGINLDGSPKHPCRMPYSRRFVPFEEAA
jgi:hypothetical protein